MKKPGWIFSALLLVFISGAGGYYFYRLLAGPAEPSVLAGKESVSVSSDIIGLIRPAFSLPDVEGKVHHISEWDGQVVALNFWATWCPPCLKEIPEFIHLQEKYNDKGLQFIGVALQEAGPVREFMQEQGMNYPVLSGELEVINIAKSYGNSFGALPYTVIIDRAGRISFVKAGPLAGSTAEEVITGLL